MKAVWLENENYWEITEGKRWWSAHRADDNPHGWFIANEALRLVSPSGTLGRRIIKAIESAMERGRS